MMVFPYGFDTLFSTAPSARIVAHAADTSGAGAPPSAAIQPDVTPSYRSDSVPQTMQTPPPSSSTGAQSGWSLPQIPSTPSSQGAGQGVNAGSGQSGATDPLLRDSLLRKQEELARKEQELRALEVELAEKLERMELLENRLTIMMKEAEEAKDAKFRHLVDVLSNMKAKAAAQVLETLDQKIAVRVLAGMRGRQAGEILTYVKPEIAASLTAALTRMQLPLE